MNGITEHYPEHEKLHLIQAKSQTCGEFIDWLASEKGWHLMTFADDSDHAYAPSYSLNRVLAEFFGIDSKKLEEEKDAMLFAMKEANS